MKKTTKDNKKQKTQVAEVMNLEKAIETLTNGSKRNFKESIDIDIILNLKEKNLKDSVKGSTTLPHKFGADKKVAVLCDGPDVEKAKKAGAVEAGLEELMDKILEGWLDFDVLLATPQVMSKIVKIGKVLGPKGLMPSPKNDTITTDVEKAVASFISGKSSFKMTQGQPAIRSKVADVKMKTNEIEENVTAFMQAVYLETKKYGSNPFRKIIISSTMGPSIKLDISDIMKRLQ